MDELSGARLAKERPGMKCVMDCAREEDDVYFWRPDRIGRSFSTRSTRSRGSPPRAASWTIWTRPVSRGVCCRSSWPRAGPPSTRPRRSAGPRQPCTGRQKPMTGTAAQGGRPAEACLGPVTLRRPFAAEPGVADRFGASTSRKAVFPSIWYTPDQRATPCWPYA